MVSQALVLRIQLRIWQGSLDEERFVVFNKVHTNQVDKVTTDNAGV